MIYYSDDLTSVREDMLRGFFAGWPRSPSSAQHLAVLRGSYRAVVAIDDADDRVVGFVNMLSDGVLTAFIPWLEVLPGYQGQGIGSELMRRILADTGPFYSVDLVCDAELVPYYERFGMRSASSALLRHPEALGSSPPSAELAVMCWYARRAAPTSGRSRGRRLRRNGPPVAGGVRLACAVL